MKGEMLVGPAKALFMDEISTGLDSSTTFQICEITQAKHSHSPRRRFSRRK
jgi:ABC-type multidrug transport system ATPase subunit